MSTTVVNGASHVGMVAHAMLLPSSSIVLQPRYRRGINASGYITGTGQSLVIDGGYTAN
ncbi:hypothetical protein ACEYW6_22330 [Nostoc sp. UIC 10607]|uniref:hypothetical protein n=1 Tax=Nostoc sp. UIC 10607 TaxID=3045935 RepID=UPI0039A2A1DE